MTLPICPKEEAHERTFREERETLSRLAKRSTRGKGGGP